MKTITEKLQEQEIKKVLFENYIPGHFICGRNILHEFVLNDDGYGNTPTYGKLLTEGLTRSYDPNATIRIVSDYFKRDPKECIIVNIYSSDNELVKEYDKLFDKNKEQIVFIKYKVYKNTKRETDTAVKKAFEFCGYYYVRKIDGGNSDYYWLCFYPKFQVKINEQVRKENKYLYHITTKEIAEKIKINGFVPKSSSDFYEYPGRIHLLKENTSIYAKEGLIRGLKKQSKNLINSEKDNRKNIEFVQIKIDLTKIPKNVNFYTDPDFSTFGIFTYENISPKTIVDISVAS